MKDKLEVGMYVRTEEGKIFKTDGDLIYLSNNKKILYKLITRVPHNSASYKVVKASFNIIDILEVGDYVNGHSVKSIQRGVKRIDIGEDENYVWLTNKDIKSIITHEQFEQMSYKLGDD